MLSLAATHMMDSSSSSTSWLADLHDLTASAPSPSPPPPAPSHHHRLLPRGAAPANNRRVASKSKRRPRPSRRLPTTYINADPASFRRMVHQVTGATHDLLLAPTTELLINRPAPATTCHGAQNNTLLLPTLDTSAFLIGAARTGTDTPSHGSAVEAPVPRLAVEADNSSASSSCGLLFPTFESWDHATLF